MLLLLALCITATQGLQLISTFDNVFIRNGTQGAETTWKQRTLTLACNNNDFRDPGLLIGNVSYDILCSAPKYTFSTRARQFVPEKRRRYIAEVCEVQTVGEFAGVPGVDEQNLGGGRRLLRYDVPEHMLKPRRKLMFIGSLVAGFIGGAVFSAACPAFGDGFAAAFGCGSGNNGGIPRAEFDDFLTKHNNTLNEQKKWNKEVEQFAINQQLINENLNVTLRLYQNEVDKLKNSTDILFNAVQSISETTTLKFSQIDDTFDNITASLAAGIDFAIGINARQQQFENATFRNFQAVVGTAQQLASNVSENNRRLLKNDQNQIRLIRQNQALAIKTILKRNIRRELNRQISRLRQRAAADGLTPFFHPGQPGSFASVSTPELRTTLVDQLTINLINQTGSAEAHQYTVSYYCSVDTILDQAFPNAVWSDLLELIGPSNCTALGGNTVDKCRCWMEITHAKCQPATNFNWQQITTTASRTAYTLTSDKCFNSAQPSTNEPWNGRKIDSIVVWHAFLSQLCNVQLAPPSGSSGTRFFQFISARQGIFNLRSPVNPAATCKPDLDYIFLRRDDPELSIPWLAYWSFERGLDTLLNEQQISEVQVHGILPNFLTHETVPFQTLNDNRTYTCYRTSFIAISTDTRPSFEVLSRNVVPLVTATAYDSPPICDQSGCVFGNPVTTESSSSGLATVNFENLLPSASRPLMGELRTQGVPAMTQVYDVCEGCAPIDDVVASRSGKITYVWQPIPINYSISAQTSYQESVPLGSGGPWPASTFLDEWQANNPSPFNHFEGQVSLDLFSRTLSGGKCLLAPEDPVGFVCEMLEQWSIHPTTNMRNGILVLVPKTWSYVVTFNVVPGEILQRVFEGCPQFEFLQYTDGRAELKLVNSLPVPLRVVSRVTVVSGNCPEEGDITHVLQPKLAQVRTVLQCGQQLISVFAIETGGTLKQCDSSINITFVPNAQANIRRFVDDVTNRSYVTDEILGRSTALQLQTVDLLTNLVPLLVTEFTPTITAPERADLINALLASYNRTLQTVQNTVSIFSSGQTVTDAIQPFVNQFNENSAVLTQLQLQVQDQLVKFDGLTANQSRQTQELSEQTTRFNAAIDEEIIATTNLKNAFDAQGKQSGECNWCGDRISGFIGDIFCPIICAVVKFLIAIGTVLLIFGFFYCCIKYAGSAAWDALKSSGTKKPTVTVPAPVVQVAPAPTTTGARYNHFRSRDPIELSPLLSQDNL